MTFINEADYDGIEAGDELILDNVKEQIIKGDKLIIKNVTKGMDIDVQISMSERQKKIMLDGGLLNFTRKQNS
jgi:aconitate hydratase